MSIVIPTGLSLYDLPFYLCNAAVCVNNRPLVSQGAGHDSVSCTELNGDDDDCHTSSGLRTVY